MNKQEQTLLQNRISQLEAENADLRVTVQILRADLDVLKEAVITAAQANSTPAVEKRGPGRPRKWG